MTKPAPVGPALTAGPACFEVTFPHGLTTDDGARFFTVLSGADDRPRAARRGDSSAMAFELVASAAGLRYVLALPHDQAELIRRQMLSVLPNTSLVPSTDDSSAWTAAVELRASEGGLLLARPELMPALLGSFYKLRADEAVVVQLVLKPITVASLSSTDPVFGCVMRVAVTVPGDAGEVRRSEKRRGGATKRDLPERASELLNRILLAYRNINVEPLRLLRQQWLSRVAERAPAVLEWPQILSPASLVIAGGLPVGSPMVSGLSLGRGKQLTPDPAIPTSGRRIALSTFAGEQRPLTLSVQDRLCGLYVVGPLGSGKTSLLENIIAGDMAEGHGLTVIDCKGGPSSLVERVLNLVPRHRIADVVLFDVSDTSRPVGFNVLAGDNAVRTTSELTSVFDRLFDFSTHTPRALDVLRSTILTLAEAGMTLCEIAVVLEPGLRGESFRDRVLPQITNPELLSFWRWYQGQSARDQSDIAAPILRRLRALLLYPGLRLSLGQATSGFDVDDILAQNKILLVPLARGQLGDELAQLVGALVATQIWAAYQRRGPGARPHFWFIDEFQDLLRHIPTTAGEIAAQIRGYNGGLTLANQHIGHLDSRMRDEVFADLRSKVVFQTTLGTRELAGQMGQGVSPQDIENLGAYEVFARLHVAGQTRPAATGRTYPPAIGPGLAQAVRAASRTRYGRAPEQVEDELSARHSAGHIPSAPTGGQTGEWDGLPDPDELLPLPAGWEPWA